MLGPVIRIGLRYLAGFLVAKGILSPEMGSDLATDADVIQVMEIAAGFVIAGATEGFYLLARRFGWSR